MAKALFDMTEIEGVNEKKRRELVLRSDFNLCDCFKMFGGLSGGKRGIDCDDLYYTITQNLELTITKDEVFIMFYKLDKDGDGLISYDEMSNCFMPRAHEYSLLLQSRGGFYGGESDFKKYFEGPTRDLLKRFIKGFVDCEVSIELVRQRICNKIRINNFTAFSAMDEHNRGVLTIDDFRNFIKKANIYPIEKDLALLYERFDKDDDKHVTYEEFVAAITPFMNSDQL
jgi:Ca2+-binding EF-hand superfamily protein